jgi:hypothetical protein
MAEFIIGELMTILTHRQLSELVEMPLLNQMSKARGQLQQLELLKFKFPIRLNPNQKSNLLLLEEGFKSPSVLNALVEWQ